MIASMTLADIQTKYAEIHTPEEVAQFPTDLKACKWEQIGTLAKQTTWSVHRLKTNADCESVESLQVG